MTPVLGKQAEDKGKLQSTKQKCQADAPADGEMEDTPVPAGFAEETPTLPEIGLAEAEAEARGGALPPVGVREAGVVAQGGHRVNRDNTFISRSLNPTDKHTARITANTTCRVFRTPYTTIHKEHRDIPQLDTHLARLRLR